MSTYPTKARHLLHLQALTLQYSYFTKPTPRSNLSMASPLFLFLLFLLRIASIHVTGDQTHQILFEDGYTVTTVMDGHKLNINPHAVQLRSSDLVVLDSAKSVFYTVPFPISQDSVSVTVKTLSGNGAEGYLDGEPGLAQFNKPKSFAVDLKGNVYVADKSNRALRKISNLGMTTTIAGSYSEKPGRQDGPGKNVTFSDDFEVVFVPQICALLISDHGTQLLRQIDLKAEDCVKGSQSALGAVTFWVLGLVVSCLIGLVVGIAIRPYIIPHEGFKPLHFSKTWNRCLINLGSPILMSCFDVKSAVANSSLYLLSKRLLRLSLSHLSLMFKVNTVHSVGAEVSNKDFVSLMDSDASSYQIGNSQILADQLKDLIDFNDCKQLTSPASDILKQGEGNGERYDVLAGCGRIDDMIQANIRGFGESANETTRVDVPLVGCLGLVKRRGSSLE